MTAPAPERDTRAETLAQIAFAEYYGRQAGAALVMPSSWAMQSDASRADWEAAALAVAAHVVNPTAADYDHAAETTRLEGEIERLSGLLRDDRRSLGRIWREPQNAAGIADERLTALDQAGVRAENPEEPR